jgi:hypothetical protein
MADARATIGVVFGDRLTSWSRPFRGFLAKTKEKSIRRLTFDFCPCYNGGDYMELFWSYFGSLC